MNEIYGKIYLATNLVNGKMYVGKVGYPKTIEQRWAEHLLEGKNLKESRKHKIEKKVFNSHLNNAIAKYGQKTWNVQKIDVGCTKEELNEKERYWIKKMNTMNRKRGYNMTEGGDGGKFRQELVEKLKKSIKNKWKDPKYQKRQKRGVIEKWKDPIYREKQMKSIKKRNENQEYIKKLSDAKKKNWKDPQYRKKKTNLVKNQWKDEDFREKTLAILEESIKKKWKDPKFRKKHLKNPQYQKKKIENIEEFIIDLKENKKLKDLEEKYKMCRKTLNRNIKEILGNNIKNVTEARIFLKNKDLDEML